MNRPTPPTSSHPTTDELAEESATWVLLHGTPLTPAVWDDVAARLVGHGDVVAPDLSHRRGQPVDQAAHARRVLDRLPGSGPLHVVGHSFGGQVALELALAAPGRVRSLGIVCSRDTPFPAFARTATALRTGDRTDPDATLARWFAADQLAADGPLVAYARRCLRDADPMAWADDLDAIATYDRHSTDAILDMPISLIAARDDHVATVDAMTDLARRLPHATLHVVEGSHMSPFDDPAALVQHLLAAASGLS